MILSLICRSAKPRSARQQGLQAQGTQISMSAPVHAPDCNYIKAIWVTLVLVLSGSGFYGVARSNRVILSKFQTGTYPDTTVILFGDSSYKLTLHLFDTVDYDDGTKNAVLTFKKENKNQVKLYFRDSIYCMYPDIHFQDFNNDGIKDILVFHSTGARANPTYYLYVVEPKNHKLIRVRGFEELPNADLDEKNNIIVSLALSGTNYYSFYRINSKKKLVNLGHDFEETIDSTQYDNAIRQILREKK